MVNGKNASKKANGNTNGPTNVRTGMMSKHNGSNAMNKNESVAVATSHKQVMTKPKLMYSADGSTTVSHREYIADVQGSQNFDATAFVINPGDESTFPWLYAIARRYESYLFEELIFEYETQSGSTAVGTVILAIDYDAADAAPVSKVQALAYHNSVRAAPWQNCSHRSSSADLHKRKTYYVQSGTNDPNDAVDYDTGRLFVCRQGMADPDTLVGELYVKYKLKLMTPQLNASDVQSARITQGTQNISADVIFGSNPEILSTVPVIYNGSTGQFTFTAPWSGELIVSSFTDFGSLNFLESSNIVIGGLNISSSPPNLVQGYTITATRGAILRLGVTTVPVTGLRLRFMEYDTDFN